MSIESEAIRLLNCVRRSVPFYSTHAALGTDIDTLLNRIALLDHEEGVVDHCSKGAINERAMTLGRALAEIRDVALTDNIPADQLMCALLEKMERVRRIANGEEVLGGIKHLTSIRCLVQLFTETGKWKYEFEVEVDVNPHWHEDLIKQIDDRQNEIIKGAITRGDYYVVIDDAPQQALTPVAAFFLKRLYTPDAIRRLDLN